jgi:cytochrome c-type biogenesis protein CcmH/NrfG
MGYRKLVSSYSVITASVLILLGATAGWFFVREISRRTLLKQLPALPELSGRDQALVDEILRLDTEVRANPQSVEKIGLLGLTYHANEMFTEARTCYQVAAQESPGDYRWPYYQGIVEEALGDEDQAIKLLNRVARLQPSYVHGWARLGNLLRRAARTGEAKAAFDTARKLDPVHPHACLGLGRIAAREDHWEAVVTILEPMLKVHPLFAPALRLLSRAYVQLGRKSLFEEKADSKVPIEDVIDEPLLDAVYERSVLAFIKGNEGRGKALLSVQCTRCHSTVRIERADKSPLQWLHTLGRMQGQAGREWLNDKDTADILAYLTVGSHWPQSRASTPAE